MPSIITSELKFFRAANQSDLSTNGGRMSTTALTSGAVGTLFPNVDEAERTAGSTKYRKAFFKVDHNGPESLLDCRLYQYKNSSGDDRVTFFIGTQTDTQAGIVGSERKYGCGALNANVSAGDGTMTVAVETGTTGIFQNGDLVRVSNKANPSASGDEEFVTLTGASQVGDIVTLTFNPTLSASYLASNTIVSSVYEAGDLVAEAEAAVVTTGASGTFDDTTYPIVLNDKSCIEQNWTLTFTSATSFNISGNTVGALGAGNVTVNVSPNNPDFSLPYFTIDANAFGGTYQSGDTVTFTTHPAAVPVWIRRIVPAGAGVTATSTAGFGFDGGAE